MKRPGTLTIDETVEGTRHTLAVAGELDIVTAPQLEAAVRGVCENGAGELVVDLRRVTFIDSKGLRAILSVQPMCRDAGCEFFLIPSANSFQRHLFEVAGLVDRLPFRSVSELRQASPPPGRRPPVGER